MLRNPEGVLACLVPLVDVILETMLSRDLDIDRFGKGDSDESSDDDDGDDAICFNVVFTTVLFPIVVAEIAGTEFTVAVKSIKISVASIEGADDVVSSFSILFVFISE